MNDQDIRIFTNLEQAARDAGITFDQALRFIAAYDLLIQADRACRLQPKPPERQQ